MIINPLVNTYDWSSPRSQGGSERHVMAPIILRRWYLARTAQCASGYFRMDCFYIIYLGSIHYRGRQASLNMVDYSTYCGSGLKEAITCAARCHASVRRVLPLGLRCTSRIYFSFRARAYVSGLLESLSLSSIPA